MEKLKKCIVLMLMCFVLASCGENDASSFVFVEEGISDEFKEDARNIIRDLDRRAAEMEKAESYGEMIIIGEETLETINSHKGAIPKPSSKDEKVITVSLENFLSDYARYSKEQLKVLKNGNSNTNKLEELSTKTFDSREHVVDLLKRK